MADFTGTAGADAFSGATGEADRFFFTSANFTGLDTVVGGGGAAVDALIFTAGGSIKAAALAKTSGIERIELHFLGNSLVLTDALAATARGQRLVIAADSGNDSINGAGLTGLNRLLVAGGAGNDTIRGGAGADVLSGEAQDDLISAGAGDDFVTGGDGSDVLLGGGGGDDLDGGDGSDILRFGSAGEFASAAAINGGIGPIGGLDTVEIEGPGLFAFDARVRNIDQIVLTRNGAGIELKIGNDMAKTANADKFDGVEVDFAVPFTRGVFIDASDLAPTNGLRTGGFHHDEAPTNNGPDSIIGGKGGDILLGQGGNDSLTGGLGDDFLSGGLGFDVLVGGAGADGLSDEGGGARFRFDTAKQLASFDGEGNLLFADTVSGSGEAATMDEAVLGLGGRYDFLAGTTFAIDAVRLANQPYILLLGSGGSDSDGDGVTGDLRITADEPNTHGFDVAKYFGFRLFITEPELFQGGDSIFEAGSGHDILSLGAGNDIITGSGDGDTLTGGSGADRFRYTSYSDSRQSLGQIDLITDFGRKDHVDITFNLTDDMSKILVKPDGAFPEAADFNFFREGETEYAIAVQFNGAITRVFVNEPTGLFTTSDMVIDFIGNVKAFLDNPLDYYFAP